MIPIKIWDDDHFLSLTANEKNLYFALISFADDEGCFRADAAFWQKTVFYKKRIGELKIESMMKKIHESGLIVLGTARKGISGFHPEWHEFQTLRKDRSKPSCFSDLLVANGLAPRFQAAAEVRSDQNRIKEDKDSDEDLGFIRT